VSARRRVDKEIDGQTKACPLYTLQRCNILQHTVTHCDTISTPYNRVDRERERVSGFRT